MLIKLTYAVIVVKRFVYNEMKHYGVGMSLVLRSTDSKLLVSNIITNTKNGSRTIMNKKRFV